MATGPGRQLTPLRARGGDVPEKGFVFEKSSVGDAVQSYRELPGGGLPQPEQQVRVGEWGVSVGDGLHLLYPSSFSLTRVTPTPPPSLPAWATVWSSQSHNLTQFTPLLSPQRGRWSEVTPHLPHSPLTYPPPPLPTHSAAWATVWSSGRPATAAWRTRGSCCGTTSS